MQRQPWSVTAMKIRRQNAARRFAKAPPMLPHEELGAMMYAERAPGLFFLADRERPLTLYGVPTDVRRSVNLGLPFGTIEDEMDLRLRGLAPCR